MPNAHPIDARLEVDGSEVGDPAVTVGGAGDDRLPTVAALLLQGDLDAGRRPPGDGVQYMGGDPAPLVAHRAASLSS